MRLTLSLLRILSLIPLASASLSLAKLSLLLVNFELAFGLLEYVLLESTPETSGLYLALRTELSKFGDVLYSKSVLRQFSGKFTKDASHIIWLRNVHAIYMANPWTTGIDYTYFYPEVMDHKLFQSKSISQIRSCKVIKEKAKFCEAFDIEIWDKSKEPSAKQIKKNAKLAITNFVTSRVENLVAKKVQKEFGGPLLSFQEILDRYTPNISLFEKLDSIIRARMIYNKLPILEFTQNENK